MLQAAQCYMVGIFMEYLWQEQSARLPVVFCKETSCCRMCQNCQKIRLDLWFDGENVIFKAEFI